MRNLPHDLTEREAELLDLSLEIVGEGYATRDAAYFALAADPAPDPDFAHWLQAGTPPSDPRQRRVAH